MNLPEKTEHYSSQIELISETLVNKSFTRDVRNIGHFGTGDLEITIRNEEDLTKAEPLILRSYEGS